MSFAGIAGVRVGMHQGGHVTTEPEELTPSINLTRIDISEETPFFDSSGKILENGLFRNEQSPPVKPNFEDEAAKETDSETVVSLENKMMEIEEVKQQDTNASKLENEVKLEEEKGNSMTTAESSSNVNEKPCPLHNTARRTSPLRENSDTLSCFFQNSVVTRENK